MAKEYISVKLALKQMAKDKLCEVPVAGIYRTASYMGRRYRFITMVENMKETL